MTEDELARWNLLNWQARLNVARSTPCEDCTAAFSAEMRGLGLCNGFPGPQRYCVRCQRWWLMDRWAIGPRGYACLVCRRRAYQRKRYKIRMSNPAYRARMAARKREQLAAPGARARKNALSRAWYRAKYAIPEWREKELARRTSTRASRARAKA